jgi:hypothetical protein
MVPQNPPVGRVWGVAIDTRQGEGSRIDVTGMVGEIQQTDRVMRGDRIEFPACDPTVLLQQTHVDPHPRIQRPLGVSFAVVAMASRMLVILRCGGTRQSTDTGSKVVRLKWLCGSMNPGSSVRPARWTTVVSGPIYLAISALAPTATMCPPCTATASARRCRASIVKTFPPISTRSIIHLPGSSFFRCGRTLALFSFCILTGTAMYAELLEQGRHLEIETPSLDFVIFQIIGYTQWHADILARSGNPCEFAYVPADKIPLGDGLLIFNH